MFRFGKIGLEIRVSGDAGKEVDVQFERFQKEKNRNGYSLRSYGLGRV